MLKCICSVFHFMLCIYQMVLKLWFFFLCLYNYATVNCLGIWTDYLFCLCYIIFIRIVLYVPIKSISGLNTDTFKLHILSCVALYVNIWNLKWDLSNWKLQHGGHCYHCQRYTMLLCVMFGFHNASLGCVYKLITLNELLRPILVMKWWQFPLQDASDPATKYLW